MHEGLEPLLWIAGIVIAYAFVSNRLLAISHPLRVRAGALVIRLLHDERLPEGHRRIIERRCETLMNTATAWRFVLIFPYSAVRALRKADPLDDLGDRKLRARVQRAVLLSGFGTLCMSPLALVLFLMQCLVAVLLFMPITRILDAIAERPDFDTASTAA